MEKEKKVTQVRKPTSETKKKEYYRAIGRRKTATAIIRLTKATKNSYTINGKDLADYFKTIDLKKIVTSAFEKATPVEKFEVVITARGGGIHAQAEAIRHGISRALVKENGELRGVLKKAKMLKRDPRVVERKKFGLKKARKSPQWSKR
jgi:small subunit ribosomal protein S9